MSEEKLRELPRSELLDQWPRSDEGQLCARLLKRYVFTLLVDTAAAGYCDAARAQAEAAANKALARLVKDFALLEGGAPEQKKPLGMKSLNRFSNPKPEDRPQKP